MRFRRIRPNHSTATPSRIICLDTLGVTVPATAARPERYRRLWCGHIRYVRLRGGRWIGDDALDFTDPAACWRWICGHLEPRAKTWLVAHDARQDYTLAGMWDELDRGRLLIGRPASRRRSGAPAADPATTPAGLFVFSAPPVILELVTPDGAPLVAVDMANWHKGGPADFARAQGSELPPAPDGPHDQAAAAEYLRASVDVTLRQFVAMCEFTRVNNLGLFRYTAAGQSMASFRHDGMDSSIVTHDDIPTLEIEHQAYYAGWCQPLATGLVPTRVAHIDINGLYPWVMARYQYPVAIHASDMSPAWSDGPPPVMTSRAIAEVEIVSPGAAYPVRLGGRLRMAIGRFCTTLCGPELARAVWSGHVIRHRRWVEYQVKPIFARWVDKMSALRSACRAAGDPLAEQYVKLLMASLHGKFAQQTGGFELGETIQPPVRWGMYLETDRSARVNTVCLAVAGRGFRRVPRRPMVGSCPAISAFIASYGRETMRWWVETLGVLACYYVGVDSLIVAEEALDTLRGMDAIHDNELGKWRLKSVNDECLIVTANHYRLDGHSTSSGIKDTAWHDERGLVIQDTSPDLTTVLAAGPTASLPLGSHTRDEAAECERARHAGFSRVLPVELHGHPLRMYDGQHAIDTPPDLPAKSQPRRATAGSKWYQQSLFP